MGQATVVERQVGDEAGLLVGAVGKDEGALVGGMVDEATLRWRLVCAQYALCSRMDGLTSSSSMVTSLLRSVSLAGVSLRCSFAHASSAISDMARIVRAKGRAEYLERRHRCTVARTERSFIVITCCFMRAGAWAGDGLSLRGTELSL